MKKLLSQFLVQRKALEVSIAKNKIYGDWKRAVAETLLFWLSFKLALKIIV